MTSTLKSVLYHFPLNPNYSLILSYHLFLFSELQPSAPSPHGSDTLNNTDLNTIIVRNGYYGAAFWRS